MSVETVDSGLGQWSEELDVASYAEGAMSIPGRGDPGSKCGDWAPREFCDECAEIHMGQNRCERRECPDCEGLWIRDRAVGAVQRLAGARYAEAEGIDRRLVHAVMSPPEGDVQTLQQVSDGFRDAYRLAERQGIRGGVAVFHGFRVLEEVQDEHEAADPGKGLWDWIKHDRPENWRDLTYWSPHWHILGLCEDMAENHPEEQDGWVAERIRGLAPFGGLTDREGYRDMARVAYYVLSHATFEEGRDCVRWFGELATTNFQPDEALSQGSQDTIERHVEEIVGPTQEDDESDAGGPGEDESRECEHCGSTSWSSIFQAGYALQDQGWCSRLEADRERRLVAAWEWVIGDRIPPPGLKNPRNEEEAIEALEALV